MSENTISEQPEVVEFNGEVDALLAEREGYLARGLSDRVAETDEQLKIRGYKASKRSAGSQTSTPADPPADPSTSQEATVPTTDPADSTPAPAAAAVKRAAAAPKGAPKGRAKAPADTA